MFGKRLFFIYLLLLMASAWVTFYFNFSYLWLVIPLCVVALSIYDLNQTRLNVLKVYPVIGHFRYLALELRPMIHRYFVESNLEGVPFNREDRELVYKLSHDEEDVLPFGTQLDVHKERFETIKHSMSPCEIDPKDARHLVGGASCKQPYLASRLNISAMSYGALGYTAISALNKGAKMAGCAHNTGEGGLSPYHQMGGDVIFQFGTGLFGVRTPEGHFDPDKFKKVASNPQVKMIEIKISQGAKPGHGGLLPQEKITPEIAEIRGVPMGKDCLSPAVHESFKTPIELLNFIEKLRDLSGGKPIGFKICLGLRKEFMGIVKAMLLTNILPDFITIDGAEGGTGAAPLTFSNHVGTPIEESLIFIHNTLVGVGLRDQLTLIASGKVAIPFKMVSMLAMGADMCNSARGMMFSLGCIQSLKCHANTCPTGIATTDRERAKALNVDAKAIQVANYHRNFMKHVLEVVGAAGIQSLDDLGPMHIQRRLATGKIRTYQEIFTLLEPNQLLDGNVPAGYQKYWDLANADSF